LSCLSPLLWAAAPFGHLFHSFIPSRSFGQLLWAFVAREIIAGRIAAKFQVALILEIRHKRDLSVFLWASYNEIPTGLKSPCLEIKGVLMEALRREKRGKQEKKKEEKLPFCTTAASPEHSRADSDDEPCDDSRGAE
jgi:hypothetical protein